ncbi:MAG: HAD family hydrolase [Deltaproteobacteria bacterium]|nr:HAD family hydrolase [Deltaproteobacteria bacterium]
MRETEKSYRAVLFDLFGTVALFAQERLPLFEWQGKTTRSTMGQLRTVIEEKIPAIPFARFFTAMSAVNQELGVLRNRDMREFSSTYRFNRVLLHVGLPEATATRQLARELADAHMEVLAGVTTVPPDHVNLLARVFSRYRVALVSNFDHAATARRIIERDGAFPYFHHVVISDEHGWRKPHPRIFTDALNVLQVSPSEALFVGDSPYDDIVGARQVGMDIAWVNALDAPLPEHIPVPDYTVHAIPELRHVLNISGPERA